MTGPPEASPLGCIAPAGATAEGGPTVGVVSVDGYSTGTQDTGGGGLIAPLLRQTPGQTETPPIGAILPGGGSTPPTPPLAIDLETTSVDPETGSILSVAVSDGSRTVSWYIESPSDLDAAAAVLRGPETIVHYAPMEGSWRELYFGEDRVTVSATMIDTAILAFRVDPGQPMKLASVAARHLPEISGWKTETESLLVGSPSMMELPREEVLRRNAVDAYVTRKLYDKLWPMLTEEERNLHREDVSIVMFNTRMARRGLHIDEERLIALRKSCQATMDEERAWLQKFTGHEDLNPGSTQQMGKILEEKGASLPRTDTGQPSTNGLALKILRHETRDENLKALVDHLLKFRKAQDILGDNVTAYAQGRRWDGRVANHSYWPATVTWRPKCPEINLLAVPRKGVRHVFTAPPGMTFMEIDLKQAEPRISAQVSMDPMMLKEFNEGLDPYIDMARYMYEKQDISRDERQVGKVIYLSAEYGIGEQTLWESMVTDGLIVDPSLVRRGLRYYWKKYSRLGEYIDECEAKARAGEDLYAPMGGYHWGFDDMKMMHPKNEEEALRSVFNATIQSVPPRIVYKAGLILERDMEIVNSIYDSLMGYVRSDLVIDLARHVHQVFKEIVEQETWLTDVKLPVEIKVGPSWGELKEVSL